jgi:hypothetical protein
MEEIFDARYAISHIYPIQLYILILKQSIIIMVKHPEEEEEDQREIQVIHLIP